MSTKNDNRIIQPYLFFNGSCEQAIEFYRKALGAEVEMMMRFKESPEPPPPGAVPPGSENKIMHASFRIGHFDGRKVKLESIRTIAGPGVAHLKYRVLK